ncbi:histidine phosphatase family protein [Burkholderia diffusa]|uniref:histidine phosphatase family protein n=1 Tax=Burkholderia diffusa TaxID=488732 RepID=UPI0007556146|nr:histidine phosphatase family protein [Burkholderia diffusa]KVG31604.1 phosphoglycerate mutase [Burkholderia diffusa]KVH47208.1 phosphoglycerate mutase [Burkholderia diffusa]
MDLLIIRHGQSNANANGLLISNDRDELSALGRSQSERLRVTLAQYNYAPSRVISSPWCRARQTAETIFDRQSIEFDARLAETHPGVFGTWLERDFNATYPEFNRDIRNTYEGGESHWDMTVRVRAWTDEAVRPAAAGPGLLAVVAHGGPISVILQHLLGVPIESHYPTFTVPNASFTYLKWRPDLERFCVERLGHV